MFHSLTARVYLMIAEGASTFDAVLWVIRRIPRNLKQYYTVNIIKEIVNQ